MLGKKRRLEGIVWEDTKNWPYEDFNWALLMLGWVGGQLWLGWGSRGENEHLSWNAETDIVIAAVGSISVIK